jgi:16S rRNA (guanine527-N7)-methyltransferase
MLPENKKALLALANDVNLQAHQREQALLYVELIEDWNARTNLVSRQDVGRLVSRHLRESLWFCLPEVLAGATKVLDLGSGAGFPGVPMKIMRPDLQLTLLDSRKMKALFLAEVVRQLAWPDVQVQCERAENLPTLFPGHSFDLVVCRAVAKLDELWRWSEPLLLRGGRLAALKGGDLEKEFTHLRRVRPAITWEMIPMPELPDDPSAGRKMILVRKS